MGLLRVWILSVAPAHVVATIPSVSDPAGIPALIGAISHLHDCGARWVESVAVHQT
jgi:hypothetical protein